VTHGGGHFLDVFRGQNLKRTCAGMLVGAGQQLIGIDFMVGYVLYFLTLSHISNPFNWDMYLFAVKLISNIVSYGTMAKFGRQEFIVWRLAGMAVIDLAIDGLNVIEWQILISEATYCGI
jgi:hypothetical protein